MQARCAVAATIGAASIAMPDRMNAAMLQREILGKVVARITCSLKPRRKFGRIRSAAHAKKTARRIGVEKSHQHLVHRGVGEGAEKNPSGNALHDFRNDFGLAGARRAPDEMERPASRPTARSLEAGFD